MARTPTTYNLLWTQAHTGDIAPVHHMGQPPSVSFVARMTDMSPEAMFYPTFGCFINDFQ